MRTRSRRSRRTRDTRSRRRTRRRTSDSCSRPRTERSGRAWWWSWSTWSSSWARSRSCCTRRSSSRTSRHRRFRPPTVHSGSGRGGRYSASCRSSRPAAGHRAGLAARRAGVAPLRRAGAFGRDAGRHMGARAVHVVGVGLARRVAGTGGVDRGARGRDRQRVLARGERGPDDEDGDSDDDTGRARHVAAPDVGSPPGGLATSRRNHASIVIRQTPSASRMPTT